MYCMAAEVLKTSLKASGRLKAKVTNVTTSVKPLRTPPFSLGMNSRISIPNNGKKVIRLRRWSVMGNRSFYLFR